MMKNDLSLFLTFFVEGEGGSTVWKFETTVENIRWNCPPTLDTSVLKL